MLSFWESTCYALDILGMYVLHLRNNIYGAKFHRIHFSSNGVSPFLEGLSALPTHFLGGFAALPAACPTSEGLAFVGGPFGPPCYFLGGPRGPPCVLVN